MKCLDKLCWLYRGKKIRLLSCILLLIEVILSEEPGKGRKSNLVTRLAYLMGSPKDSLHMLGMWRRLWMGKK